MWSGTANDLLPLAPEGRWQKLKASDTDSEESQDTEMVSAKDPDHWAAACGSVHKYPPHKRGHKLFQRLEVACQFHSGVLTNLSLAPPRRKHLMLSFSDITVNHICPIAVTLRLSLWLVIPCFILFFSW